MPNMLQFVTKGGLAVTKTAVDYPYQNGTRAWQERLNAERGAVFSSNYEYPGRYSRWDTAVVNPPLVLTTKDRHVRLEALNARGEILMPLFDTTLSALPDALHYQCDAKTISFDMRLTQERFAEEDRSRQPSVFSALRALIAVLACDDGEFGFYGAFGYDLAYQFEDIERRLARPDDQRDMVLYLVDEVLTVDHYARRSQILRYEFSWADKSTEGLPRTGQYEAFQSRGSNVRRGDHEPGEYAKLVERAKAYFKRGDLFEVVPGQIFYQPCAAPPAQISQKLQSINPSPYGFLINLGAQEYLVGASPEMYVKVTGGKRVETCPISGTIRRGKNPIEDAVQIRTLLNSEKDEAELTMCSDVDRNDKSRVCEPGSVRVIGRRQIEMYSKLIHTVDHIEGVLRAGMDALDAFLSHTWAVTVTGAPKRWAMDFIEQNEKSPRAWYGGAVGMIPFNGDLNTGLTLRTIRIKDGVAQIRAGATLLFDSDPEAEEAETELKAAAMIAAVREAGQTARDAAAVADVQVGAGRKVLFVDHQDSFVHTLANYVRQTGAEVETIRAPLTQADLHRAKPDLVFLSPGPGAPTDFECATSIRLALEHKLPIFGVCLGLQALTEAFGGKLKQLDIPMHGKPSLVIHQGKGPLFAGLPPEIVVGRYHSLVADPDYLPSDFAVTAETQDHVIMAIEHKSLPIAAVQFHPESIMSLGEEAGHKIIANALASLR